MNGAPIRRIAICLFGQIRMWELCSRSLARHVIAPMRAEDTAIDVFAHTWSNDSNGFNVNNRMDASAHDKCEQRLLNGAQIAGIDLTAHIITRPLSWKSECHNMTFYTVVSMWASIEQSWGLASAHAKQHGFEYDTVVCARCDCVWLSEWNFAALRPSAGADKFFAPDGLCTIGGMTDTVFAVTSHSKMDCISRLRSCIPTYTVGHGIFPSSEFLLAFHLNHNHICACPCGGPYDYGIIRNFKRNPITWEKTKTCEPYIQCMGFQAWTHANDYTTMMQLPPGERWLKIYDKALYKFRRTVNPYHLAYWRLDPVWFPRPLPPQPYIMPCGNTKSGWWIRPEEGYMHADLDAAVIKRTHLSRSMEHDNGLALCADLLNA